MPQRLPEDAPRYVERNCQYHGVVVFVLRSSTVGRNRGYRCAQCEKERRAQARKRVRDDLIATAGGACVRCGYDRCSAALHFHHLDPTTKQFQLSKISSSLRKAQIEAAKCVLLCANCHAETHYAPMV